MVEPGLTQSTIQRVLAAKVHITLDTLQRLADAFGIDPVRLLVPKMDSGALDTSDLSRRSRTISGNGKA